MKPCPWCGNAPECRKLHGSGVLTSGVTHRRRHTWQVTCPECATSGPVADSPEKAQAGWVTVAGE